MKQNPKLQFGLLVAIPFFLILILTGFVASQLRRSEMIRLQTANPRADLQTAIKKKDLRFIGLGGYVGTVPGNSLVYKLSDIKGVKYVEGTGDGNRHIFYGRLIGGVRKYAEQYNTLLAHHILQTENSNPKIRRLRRQR